MTNEERARELMVRIDIDREVDIDRDDEECIEAIMDFEKKAEQRGRDIVFSSKGEGGGE